MLSDLKTAFKHPISQVLILIFTFLAVSFIVQTNIEWFENWFDHSTYGKVAYVVFEILATVFAPVSSLPLIPVVAKLWGPFTAAILNIIGWFIGSIIAFELSRALAQNILGRIVNIKSAESISKLFAGRSGLWNLILLRMAVPVDILSYALGLFSDVSRKNYYLATAIGIIPFAFIWSYFSDLPFIYQLVLIVLAGCIIGLVWYNHGLSKRRSG